MRRTYATRRTAARSRSPTVSSVCSSRERPDRRTGQAERIPARRRTRLQLGHVPARGGAQLADARRGYRGHGDSRTRAGDLPRVGGDRRRAGRTAHGPCRPDAGDPRRVTRSAPSAAASSREAARSCARPRSSPPGSRCSAAPARSIQLTRAAAAEMFPPDRRARGMSLVLFGAVVRVRSGGRVVFGPLFAHRAIDAQGLVGPWLVGIPFMLVGLGIVVVRPAGPEGDRGVVPGRAGRARSTAVPLREIAAPAGRSGGGARGRRELRGHGERHEPRGLRRRRARPSPGRRVHDDQRPHPRDVRADADRRRRRSTGSAAAGASWPGSTLMTLSNVALVWLGGVGGHEPRPARPRAGLEPLVRRRHDRARRAHLPVRAGPPRRLHRLPRELHRGRVPGPSRRARLQRLGRRWRSSLAAAALAAAARLSGSRSGRCRRSSCPQRTSQAWYFATIPPRRTHGPPLSCL